MSDRELLRLERIKKSFAQTEVLRGLDLSVGTGEFITLLGPSGCGKTTVLRIIAGLETADAGRVFMDGLDVTSLSPDLRGVNMVFQNYALFPHMNVEKNIGYSLKLKGFQKTDIRRAVADSLAMVQLSGFEKRQPHELSGGQRQRVAVARALINRPKVLLLDEPLGALDLQLRRQMQAELKRLQKQVGITFVYITHDQEEALAMSDRIAVMRNGVFEQVGSAAEVYKKPRTAFVAKFVGNANLIPIGSAGAAGADEYLAVREENIILTPANRKGMPLIERLGLSPKRRSLTAVITGKTFAGGLLRITARLKNTEMPDGEEICAGIQDIDTPFAEGDEVTVSWLPQNAVTVKR